PADDPSAPTRNIHILTPGYKEGYRRNIRVPMTECRPGTKRSGVNEGAEIRLQLRNELPRPADGIGHIDHRPLPICGSHHIRISKPVELQAIDGIAVIGPQVRAPHQRTSVRRDLRDISVTGAAGITSLDNIRFIAGEIGGRRCTGYIDISCKRIGLEHKTRIRTRSTQKAGPDQVAAVGIDLQHHRILTTTPEPRLKNT